MTVSYARRLFFGEQGDERPIRPHMAARSLLRLRAFGPEPTPRPPPRSGRAPTRPRRRRRSRARARDRPHERSRSTASSRFELYSDAAPIATANFVALVRCRFYDGISFHRVIADFVIQAGDPQTRSNRGDFQGIGSGGPGYSFAIEPPASDARYEQYVVAMANAAGDTNGSQFFIDLANLDRPGSTASTPSSARWSRGPRSSTPSPRCPATSRTGVPLEPVIIESITISAAARTAHRGKSGLNPLRNVNESKPQPLSKADHAAILSALFAQRFTTDRKAMGRLG